MMMLRMRAIMASVLARTPRSSNEELRAVVLQFGDRLVDVGERLVAALLLERLQRLGLPAARQFLERADVDVAVVEERLEPRHPARHEAPVLADRIAAQRRLAGRHVARE